jgi:hypothetical protein
VTNIPQRIGNYQLERQIGKGGMSQVWLARHRVLDERVVAVKLLLSQESEWVDRFTREASITTRLRHPHIVQIFDHGYQAPCYYTVMEYVPGGALRELLQDRKPLALDLALAVFRAAAGALDYAHAQGVVHRDVSPGNILVDTAQGRILLTDFGIARDAAQIGMTTINKVMGTPGYLSPEHAASATSVTYLSDLYSLGVVLFEMLTGALPWDHYPGMPDKSGGPFSAPMPLRARGATGLPPELDRVIQGMLAFEPAKRYPSAQAAVDDFERVLKRHTNTTQVVATKRGAAPSTPVEVAPEPEPHPVERMLAHDLLKAPMEEARRRAEALDEPHEIAQLLDQWSAESRFRRPLLGRQAQIRRTTSFNIYSYELRVVCETREAEQKAEEPDFKAEPIKIEKELDRWGIELPPPKGFVDEEGARVRLPGTTRVTNCEKCEGLGRITCPRCKGRQRIAVVAAAEDAAPRRQRAVTGGAAGAAVAPRMQERLAPCPDCEGKGALRCEQCQGVGRMVEHRTTRWYRKQASFAGRDAMPPADEQWLARNCAAREVYREQQRGGIRPEWRQVPALQEQIAAAEQQLDASTRIVLSEVAISFIPVTEVVFDLGEAASKGSKPGNGGLYRWHIYGFERRLPRDWRFLNWDRVAALVLSLLLVLTIVLLALALVRL